MDGTFSRKFKGILIFLVLIVVILSIIALNHTYTPVGKLSSSPTPSPIVLPSLSVHPTTEPVASSSTSSAVLGTTTREKAIVKRVVDGDTIQLADGRKVRYIGIDTPETVKPGVAPECFGKEASNKNKELVAGKEIEMEKDVSETDRYGRLLRLVYVEGEFVNDYLVRQGFAYASTYPPDVRYSQQFREAQREAEAQNRGLWAMSCPVHKGDHV